MSSEKDIFLSSTYAATMNTRELESTLRQRRSEAIAEMRSILRLMRSGGQVLSGVMLLGVLAITLSIIAIVLFAFGNQAQSVGGLTAAQQTSVQNIVTTGQQALSLTTVALIVLGASIILGVLFLFAHFR